MSRVSVVNNKIIEAALVKQAVKQHMERYLQLDLAKNKTNWLDSIESPPVIFASFVLLGCVLGFLNYLRKERRDRSRLAKPNQMNNV
ncbi:unnamed protein product [Caenorhabditis brenneri]